MTPDCKTSTNDNINPHLFCFRAQDCNCCCDWSPQVRHVEETACLSPRRKLSLFASDRGNVWLSIYVALWGLEMSPLYFPNLHREALWSSQAGRCQPPERSSYSLSQLISLVGNFDFIFQLCEQPGYISCLFSHISRDYIRLQILLLNPPVLSFFPPMKPCSVFFSSQQMFLLS